MQRGKGCFWFLFAWQPLVNWVRHQSWWCCSTNVCVNVFLPMLKRISLEESCKSIHFFPLSASRSNTRCAPGPRGSSASGRGDPWTWPGSGSWSNRRLAERLLLTAARMTAKYQKALQSLMSTYWLNIKSLPNTIILWKGLCGWKRIWGSTISWSE